MFAPRARGVADFFAAFVCLWAAAYHTPPGALLRGVFATLTDTRNHAGPLLAYYSGGIFESPSIATKGALIDLPQPKLLAAIPDGPAIGRGVFASLRNGTSEHAKAAQAVAARYQVEWPLLQDRRRGPEAFGALIARVQADLGSEDAAVLAVFAGYEAADFAVQRARSESRPLKLDVLAQQLPPFERSAVDAASQALTLGTAYGLGWPVAWDTRVSSPFGYRIHPILGGPRLHTGVDFSVAEGTEIRASARGIVRRASEDDVNGRVVIVDHGRGVSTAYCHNSKLLVSTGQQITAGQIISQSGNTGRSTGPHLHYQLELGHQPLDPFLFKSASAVDALVAGPQEADVKFGERRFRVVDGGANESDRKNMPSATEF